MAIKPKATGGSVTIYIGNTEIEIGKTYSLGNRLDVSAPDGMVKEKMTKFPFDKNDSVMSVFFDDEMGLYDTGLHQYSKALTMDRKMSQEQVKERVASYHKNIVKPYQDMYGKDLSPNSQFWKDYRFTVYTNKEYDTNKLPELFELFNVVMQGVACNEDEKDNLYKEQAAYNITSIQEYKSKKKESTKDKRNCVTLFNEMADSNREKLDTILSFINRTTTDDVENNDLKDMYYEVINDPKTGADFIKRFTEASSKYESDSGKAEMEYFKIVQGLFKKNVIKKVGSRYVTADGVNFLGTNVQDIAKFCLNTESPQHKIITELYEEVG